MNQHRPNNIAYTIGLIPGEGSGPELIDAAAQILAAVSNACGCQLQIRWSSGKDRHLSEPLIEFCEEIFATDGAILAGAMGGRFVYEMRRRFHLHYKLNPLRSYPVLAKACRLKLPSEPIDILVVRDNFEGIYQGEAVERMNAAGRQLEHTFVQSEASVRALLAIAAEAARDRRGHLAVVCKDSGLPAIHALWRGCALEAGETFGIEIGLLDIDYAAYKLVQEPEFFDVIAAPNCFGDILSDLGGVLAGSRGLTYGGSFSANDAAVYQTNHGAAHDLARTGTANPVGQIFAAAMMLRDSVGLTSEAQLIEDAVQTVWRNGWRTNDLAEPGCKIAGTQKFAELLIEEINQAAFRSCEKLSAAN